MGKKIAILQSNYLPWKGYFDIIRAVDEFVLFDAVQFTRRDWRNRNVIKTANGLQWLTISVENKGRYHQAIDETRVADGGWAAAHLRSIELSYRRAQHFDEVMPRLRSLLTEVADEPLLTTINTNLLKGLCNLLGIEVPLRSCSDLMDRDDMLAKQKTERLVALCQAAGATAYLSGPAARSYIELELFEEAGIALEWMDYSGYPEYPQLWGSFEHKVSAVDLLLNTGPDAAKYLKPS